MASEAKYFIVVRSSSGKASKWTSISLKRVWGESDISTLEGWWELNGIVLDLLSISRILCLEAIKDLCSSLSEPWTWFFFKARFAMIYSLFKIQVCTNLHPISLSWSLWSPLCGCHLLNRISLLARKWGGKSFQEIELKRVRLEMVKKVSFATVCS